MRLTSLQISNTKLLQDFVVEFGGRNWTVFVGENGKCKTTILQMIALACSGPEKANQLAGDLPGMLVDKRGGDASPTVTAGLLGDPAATHPGLPSITVRSPVTSTVIAQGSIFAGASAYQQLPPATGAFSNPISQIRGGNFPGWLAVAYGVNRNIPVPLSVEMRSDPALDRMRSLFDLRYQLVGTDFVARFDPATALHYSQLVQQALVGAEILPDIDQLDLRGRGGVTHPSALVETHRFDQRVGLSGHMRLPAVALSLGYQSTIAWIADLIGQAMIDAGDQAVHLQLENMRGLVLIDEIDLHLHPSWQRLLIRSLKRAFPSVQFIATTHSPLVLAGLEEHEVWILESDERGSVTARSSNQTPRLMTASGILQSYFHVTSVDPDNSGAKLREYGFLASTAARTDEEEQRLQSLIGELKSLGVEPDWEPVPRQTPAAESAVELEK